MQITLLKESGLIAEEKSKKKIELEDVRKAISKLDDFYIKDSGELDDEVQFILGIVKGNSGKKIGDMYKMKFSYK